MKNDTNSKKQNYFREPDMASNSEKILVGRCSLTDKEGTRLETPGEIFYRVSHYLAKAEVNWDSDTEVEKATREFFEAMADLRIVVTRSTLFEAGNPGASNQLSPCFVVPVEDSIKSIFDSLGKAAVIQKNYGGTGFNFSAIRPSGDKVRNVPNAASGPVDFLQAYSAALSKVIQGGKRHGGNMGILNVDHPDIYDFIEVKDEDQTIKNFNISVGIKDGFMKAVKKNKSWGLVNPRNNRVEKEVSAKELFQTICKHAWLTGDPGMMYLDRLEEDNFTPNLGTINATNPCGEQPLLPYESCNLSSINLKRHLVKENGQWQIDWDLLAKTAHTIIRLLDDMIEVNTYVLPETEKIARHGNRKAGAGVIGFGHVLYRMGVPYGSKESVKLAKKLSSFIRKELEEGSRRLAEYRGTFPNYDISLHKENKNPLRNCTVFTIAPTGTVSMIGNTTPGIEPTFALAYRRRTSYEKDKNNNSQEVLTVVDSVFKNALKEKGFYSEEVMNAVIEQGGSVQGVEELPKDLREVFVTTHDISWESHVRVQAAWQENVDNSVSKTINLRHDATVEEIEKAFMLAWELGCKGCTVYRDGCKEDQVIETKS